MDIENTLQYFCRESERKGTCYHEFQKGKWDEHTFWKTDSLLLSDEVLVELKLSRLFKKAIEEYDAYGPVRVTKEQWAAVSKLSETAGGKQWEAIREADVWVQNCFETEEVFYILGI